MSEYPANSATQCGQTACLNCELAIEKCNCFWAAIRELQSFKKETNVRLDEMGEQVKMAALTTKETLWDRQVNDRLDRLEKNHSGIWDLMTKNETIANANFISLKARLEEIGKSMLYEDVEGDECGLDQLAEDVGDMSESLNNYRERVRTLEKWVHDQMANWKEDKFSLLKKQYEALCAQVDNIERKGVHWIEFYNKQNSDHTGQLYQLSNQVKETLELIKDLERIVLEPIAQKVVDGTQAQFLGLINSTKGYGRHYCSQIMYNTLRELEALFPEGTQARNKITNTLEIVKKNVSNIED